jgi:hypothetical protein
MPGAGSRVDLRMNHRSAWLGFLAGLLVAAATPALADFSKDLVLDRARTLAELEGLVQSSSEVARLAVQADPRRQLPVTQLAASLHERLISLEKMAVSAPLPESPRIAWCGRPVTATQPDPCARIAMTPLDFVAFARSVRGARYPSVQLGLVQQAAQYNFLSVDQVGEVMSWFASEDDKIEVAVMLWPRLANPDRAAALFGNLRFPAGRDLLHQRIDALRK